MSKIDKTQTASSQGDSLSSHADQLASRIAVPAGILVGLIVIVANWGRNPIPMLDDLRAFAVIGFLAMIPISFFAAGYGFVEGINAWNARVGPDRQRKWGLAVVPVALAYTLATTLAIIAFMMFVEAAFQYLALITLQAALLTGAVVAMLTNWVVSSAVKLDTGRMLQLVVVIIAGGMYLTITNIDDPLWWQVSFSYLGKMESNVNLLFNLTLVFTGILLLVWLGYLMSDFRILARHGIAETKYVRWIRFGFVWLAIAIMLVGIFKSNYTPFSSLMHNWSAYSLAAVFGLFMLGGKWYVPGFPREYATTSWVLVALLAATLVSAALGRVNTVGLELVAFALGMTWLSSFVGTTDNMARELEPESFPFR
jgi:hypothetical protein